MTRFMYIALTFGVLGFAWYDLSGGAEFKPGTVTAAPEVEVRPLAARTPEPAARLPAPETVTLASVAADEAPVLVTGSIAAERPALPEIAVARRDTGTVDLTSVAPVAETAAVGTDAVAATPAEPATPQIGATPEPEPAPDLRYVTGDRVNLRSGPGTTYAVVGKLFDGDAIAVLDDRGDGWIRIRTESDGREGWMADWLVTAAN